jgi:hypothetical protein
MMLLVIGTVGYLPLILPLLFPGITVNSAKIAGWLFLLTLLPLSPRPLRQPRSARGLWRQYLPIVGLRTAQADEGPNKDDDDD